MEIRRSGKERVSKATEQAAGWYHQQRDRRGVVDLATRLFERDRDTFASVLGSAVALRLFLFVVSGSVALVGLINLFNLESLLESALASSPTTGAVAEGSAGASALTSLGLALSGLFLTAIAGRSLTRTLATCATASWGMPPSSAKLKLRAVAALIALLAGLVLATMAFDWMNDRGGLLVSTGAWVIVAAAFGVGWFAVAYILPRPTSDPGALLPAAATVAVVGSTVQWVYQIYLPGKIERNQDRYGSLGTTVATLSYFYILGRILTGSLVANATVYERFGSISEVVFRLPFVRRLPVRFPQLHTFFDLDRVVATGVVEPTLLDEGP